MKGIERRLERALCREEPVVRLDGFRKGTATPRKEEN